MALVDRAVTHIDYSNAFDVVHWVNIKVFNDKRELVEFISWCGLRWELRLKYNWYFTYRSALLQVKYPRYTVNLIWGKEPAIGKSLDDITKNKIKSRRSNITIIKSKLNLAKLHWSSLFPIEDDISYKKALVKLHNLETDLLLLESSLH